jgi:hypothetical protein
MTVKQALKEKNSLLKRINDLTQKIYSYNSIDEGNKRPYSTSDLLSQVMELTGELIDLKTKIHQANVPVYDKIFRLSELKSLVKKINGIDCSEGKVSERYSRTEPTIKTAEISVVERDTIVKDLEEQIERLQEELDVHNATTNI